MSDRLQGIARVEFTEDWPRSHLPDHDAAQALYTQQDGDFISMAQMGLDIAVYGLMGLAAATTTASTRRKTKS